MANGNANLHRAKREKNDEFYTQYSDIEKELVHYKDFFNGKTVYCNCDTIASNFMKFFDDKFDEYGLKKLIITGLKSKGGILYQRTKNSVYVGDLKGDGRFQSEECIEFLKECDVVVTNPPFSLFREYVALLMQYNKKFLIIGNMNAITYKEIFPLIKDNKLWLGTQYVKEFVSKIGEVKKFGNILWFTNLDHKKRHQEIDLYKKYNPEEYPKYDNFDAINVNKVADIPVDYCGVMGVPLTFLEKYCPDQFEIIWRGGDIDWAENECDFYTPPTKDDALRYKKQDSTWRIQNPYLIDIKGNTKVVYQRIFIKKLA